METRLWTSEHIVTFTHVNSQKTKKFLCRCIITPVCRGMGKEWTALALGWVQRNSVLEMWLLSSDVLLYCAGLGPGESSADS